MRVLLLSKVDRFSREAQANARAAFGPALVVAEGRVGDPFPAALDRPGDVLLSFLSPWIVTAAQLARFGVAINFHPGPVEYPGTGCYNFALYEGAAVYGATCHHMLPEVDTGAVVREVRLPIRPRDSVKTLKLRTMEAMLAMFADVTRLVADGRPLPAAATHWTRRPFTRREMEALKRLDHRMSPAEIERRVRATTYPGYPGPVMTLADGSRRALPVPRRAALA